MHEFFPENLRNPARASRAGAITSLQFCPSQLDSSLPACLEMVRSFYSFAGLQDCSYLKKQICQCRNAQWHPDLRFREKKK
jgi:hypothetical protein